MSAWSHVVSGVPQGTISGTVLFLIFVNDIPECCNTNVKLFADHTKLFNNNTNRIECQDLQYDLNALSAWSKTWHMNFNASKCAVLTIKPKTSFTYSLNNTPLKEENEQKDLGIIVSNDLKLRKHVLGVCTKANRISSLVKRGFTKLDKNKISTLYKSIVRPILEYGSVVWSPWPVQDKHVLERDQRRFIGLANEDISLPSLECGRNDTDLSEI